MSSPDSKEISKSADTKVPAPKKAERSTEQNLMLAFALAAVVMLGTQYFLPQPAAPAPKKDTQTATQKGAVPATAAEAVPSTTTLTPGTPAPGRIAAAAEQTQTIETDLYRVVFSNKGAVVRSWVLKKFKDSSEKPLNLVHTKLGDKVLAPFALDGTDSKPLPAVNDALYTATPTPDKLGIDFEFSDGTNYAKKTFRFNQAKYTFEFTSTVRERGIPKQHFVAWRGGFGDGTVIGAASKQQAVFYDSTRPSTLLGIIPTGVGVLVLKTASDASTGPTGQPRNLHICRSQRYLLCRRRPTRSLVRFPHHRRRRHATRSARWQRRGARRRATRR
jgi:YidC periplasmic domain